jgi:hypothetical protein
MLRAGNSQFAYRIPQWGAIVTGHAAGPLATNILWTGKRQLALQKTLACGHEQVSLVACAQSHTWIAQTADESSMGEKPAASKVKTG